MAKRVARTLVEGYKERETIDQLTKRVREETGFAKARARTIARTEFIRGCTDASLDRYERLGYKKVEFLTDKEKARHSHLTCPECRRYHGQIFTIEVFEFDEED